MVIIQDKVSSFNSYCLQQFAITESLLIEAEWDQVLVRFIKLGNKKYVYNKANFGKLNLNSTRNLKSNILKPW